MEEIKKWLWCIALGAVLFLLQKSCNNENNSTPIHSTNTNTGITQQELERLKAPSSSNNRPQNKLGTALNKVNSTASVSLHCSYDNREHTFTTKFTNNTSKTVLKIAVKISIKDLSMEYDMFDTRQYKYQTIIYDVEIPKGESVTQTRTVYIEDYSEYDGAFIDWVRYYNN